MLALLLVGVLCASASWVRMENDVTVAPSPIGWQQIGKPAPGALHRIIISMKHDSAKMRELDRIFWEVSNPQHANYGNYLTFEETRELMAATPEQLNVVTQWLESYGVHTFQIGAQGDMITAHVAVETLEAMLNTKFASWKQDKTDMIINRLTKSYYLPYEVAQVVALIGNLLDFPSWFGPRVVEDSKVGAWPNYCGTSCSGKITPEVIRQQYNLTNSVPVNGKNTMAVAEFQGQHYDYTDINMFTDACAIPRLTVNDIYNNNQPSGCSVGLCVEALLDIEFLYGVAGQIPLSDYYSATYSLLDWMQGVLATNNASLVHSVSYGNDEVQQTSTDYMFQCNTQFQAAATRGLTIMFASGDQGVWGRSGHTGKFNPDFPAASPYIFAVGGTDLTSANLGPEHCCQDSGGGFSNTFGRPSYQDAAVTGYINSGVTLPPQNLWNASGRAYPDASAIFGLVVSYCIAESGKWVGVAGTSASSPVVASMIANLNNVQLNNNKPALGFLNQWWYQTLAAHPDAFFDVTTGTNNGGSGEGFTATKGWDPCTGVGTVNYKNLVNYLP